MAKSPKAGADTSVESGAEAPSAVRVTAAKCVRCGAPVQARFRPFCSRRCADIDLGQWASGTYRIPTPEPGPGEDDGEA
jgi:endogenous inhibitor of DNA gyrase (YacG/DUF329 family)